MRRLHGRSLVVAAAVVAIVFAGAVVAYGATQQGSSTSTNPGTITSPGPPPTVEPGYTFQPESPGSEMDFTSSTTGWFVWPAPGGGTLFHTTDGGATWTARLTDSAVGTSVDFSDPEHGWIAGSPDGLLTTSDGGATWDLLAPPGSSPHDQIYKVDFVDSKYGFALSDANLLFATSDGGGTWTQLSVPSAVSDMCFSSPSIGFASTYLGIYVTTNGGAQWSLSNRPQLPADLGAFPIACSGSSAVVIGDPTGNSSPIDVFQTLSALDDQGQAEAGTWTEPVNADDPASSAPVPLAYSVENQFLFQTGPAVGIRRVRESSKSAPRHRSDRGRGPYDDRRRAILCEFECGSELQRQRDHCHSFGAERFPKSLHDFGL